MVIQRVTGVLLIIAKDTTFEGKTEVFYIYFGPLLVHLSAGASVSDVARSVKQNLVAIYAARIQLSLRFYNVIS